MASGADGTQPDPMMGVLAVPTTPGRRSLPQGSSPSARRVRKRQIVPDPGAPPAETTRIQLVSEVHRMHLQWAKDNDFMLEAHDAINDHSDALKLLKTHIMSLKGEIEKLTANVVGNDADLKEGLKYFESTVTNEPPG